MAELNTLARPYARAAFEFADDKDSLTDWSAGLELLSALVAEDKVADLLDNPALTSEAKAKALVELLGDQNSAELQNFVYALADNKRLSLLPIIARQFEALKAEREKSIEVQITSAYELSQAQVDALSKALTQRLKREVLLQTDTDPSLIGGAYIQANDTVIDASLRGRVAKLAEAMNS